MNKLTTTCLMGLLLLLPSVPSFGALIGVATPVANPPAIPFNAPDAALPAPWRSYQLSIQATNGELVGAVDVTISGPLHQRWNDNDFDGVTDPSPNGTPSNGRGDSHLTPPAGSPFGVGPSETNSKTGSPLTSTPGEREYGLGGLRGAWAILNPQPVTNLAYIVVRGDQLHQLRLTVLSADPSGNPLPTLTEGWPPPRIPEPATITMMALALLGVAARVRIR